MSSTRWANLGSDAFLPRLHDLFLGWHRLLHDGGPPRWVAVGSLTTVKPLWLNGMLGCSFRPSDGMNLNGWRTALCLRLGLRHEILTACVNARSDSDA
jgi:hypothetical protein